MLCSHYSANRQQIPPLFLREFTFQGYRFCFLNCMKWTMPSIVLLIRSCIFELLNDGTDLLGYISKCYIEITVLSYSLVPAGYWLQTAKGSISPAFRRSKNNRDNNCFFRFISFHRA